MQVEELVAHYEIDKKETCPAIDKSPSIVDDIIEKIVKQEDFITYRVNKKEIKTNGGNYLGLLYEVDIKGKTSNGEKEENIFIKHIMPNHENLEVLSVKDVYERELYVYKELFKIFTEIQDKAKIPLKERYKTVKCLDESNTEAIVLENLTKKGFSTYHRMDTISLKFAEKSIKELAKFHALSFAIKELKPDYFDRQMKTKNMPMKLDPWKSCIKNIRKIVNKYLDDDIKDKVEALYNTYVDKYINYIKDESIKKCLCHGDFRPNNIMTKETVSECELITIDYQLINYGCPIFDFLYFIYSSTDREFRKLHLEDLKNMYFETMSKFLTYFDIDIEAIFPRKTFEKMYKEKLDYGLMHTLFFVPFLFALDDDVPDVTSDIVNILEFQMDDKFKERFSGTIEEFTEWGYI